MWFKCEDGRKADRLLPQQPQRLSLAAGGANRISDTVRVLAKLDATALAAPTGNDFGISIGAVIFRPVCLNTENCTALAVFAE